MAINTYIPNYVYRKNFGYPIVGEDKVDIITKMITQYTKDAEKIKSFKSKDTSNYSYNPFYIVNEEDWDCSSGKDCQRNVANELLNNNNIEYERNDKSKC